MNSNKLSYPKIKPLQLQNEPVKPEHESVVEELLEKISKDRSTQSFIYIIMIVFISLMVIMNINKDEYSVYDYIIPVFILIPILVYQVIRSVNLKAVIMNQNYLKTQYGEVLNKFSRDYSDGDGAYTGRDYYADVLFPVQQNRLVNVSCFETDYGALSKGSEVLVVALDKRTAYLVPIPTFKPTTSQNVFDKKNS